MNNSLIQLVKEFAGFLGKKLDAIANKNTIGVEIKGAEIITIKGEKGESGDGGKDGQRGDKGRFQPF